MSTKTKMYRKGGAEKIVVPVPVAGYHAIEKFSRIWTMKWLLLSLRLISMP